MLMTERLLQFIWQFQYFNKNELTCGSGEVLRILFPGQYNSNQGPDFSNAKIRIGNTMWAGSIELHIQTSDWEKHRHHHDKNYNNVILHVVWEDDGTANTIPVLELKSRVPKILLQRYEELMHAGSFIPCEKNIHTAGELTWKSWKERLLVERLLRKSKMIEDYLHQNNHHWEETLWWLLARNFGMKVNAEAFEMIARSIPSKLLAKRFIECYQLEALLFGQAGLLAGRFEDEYASLLQQEYRFQKKGYALRHVHAPLHFLRMRPGNFPTIRLAQLAMLLHKSRHLFSKIREAGSVNEIRQCFDITASDYWHDHYRFDETSVFKKKRTGAAMIDNIIINTVVPVVFAYGNYCNEQKYKDRALQWLEETEAEINSITNGFAQLNIKSRDAYDSQALIELKNEYCNKKNCLDCRIGNNLLKG